MVGRRINAELQTNVIIDASEITTASGVQRHTVTSLSKISLIEVRDLCAILWRYRFTVLLLEGKRGRFLADRHLSPTCLAAVSEYPAITGGQFLRTDRIGTVGGTAHRDAALKSFAPWTAKSCDAIGNTIDVAWW